MNRFTASVLGAAGLLAGCSALQIDVDVYTGKLDSNPELQVQHYVTLAMAAKPMLEGVVTDSAESKDAYRQALAKTLSPSLTVYTEAGGLEAINTQLNACPIRALDKVCQAHHDNANRRIVQLAGRLLLAANTFQLSQRAGDDEQRSEADKTALHNDVAAIQSLGNTLMVHARDLDRQRQHNNAQNDTARLKLEGGEQQRVLAALEGLDLDVAPVAASATAATLPPAPVPAAGKTKPVKHKPAAAPPAAAASPGQPAALPPTAPTITAAEASRQLQLLSQSNALPLPEAVAEAIQRRNVGALGARSLSARELPQWAQAEVLALEQDLMSNRALTTSDLAKARNLSTGLGLAPDGSLCLNGGDSSPHLLCGLQGRLDQAEQFITALRMRRIQALAQGKTQTAQALQKAINAAGDLRTAMIYLRPASDYLRSVYTASAYQEAQAPRYRNMLTEWRRYLVTNRDKNGALVEIDKLAWQNVNQVSVSGGGNTNYVLAKDDVGNWYVKSYAADPEPIIRAATSLALYNTGAKINQNLLSRLQDQRKLDDERTPPADKARLRESLQSPAMNGAEGETLLKLRAQHLARYQQDSRTAARRLAEETKQHAAAAQAVVASLKSVTPPACKLAELSQRVTQGTRAEWLASMSITLLESERGLENALAVQATAGGSAQSLAATQLALDRLEDDHAKALAALLGYAEGLDALLDPVGAEGCDPPTRSAAAQEARRESRKKTLALAKARQDGVQTYAERLEELSAVALAR